jgi:hypothetical protein
MEMWTVGCCEATGIVCRFLYRIMSTLTAAILLAKIRKSPDVPQSNRVSNDTEEELQFVAPRRAISVDVDVSRRDAVPVRSASLRRWRHNNSNARTRSPIVSRVQWRQLVAVSRFRFPYRHCQRSSTSLPEGRRKQLCTGTRGSSVHTYVIVIGTNCSLFRSSRNTYNIRPGS